MAVDKQLLSNIARLSIPAVITNITTPLLALSDTAIMGHMGGAVYLAAIAVGGTVFNMIYWLFGFLRMGSSGLTAQAYGAGDRKEAHAVLTRALSLGVALGLLMIALQRPIEAVALSLLDADGITLEWARTYFRVCIWGAPAMLGMFALTGWCIGMQNSRLPMWTSIFIDLLNIALSVTLVFGLRWGVEGCAVGTMTAQWAGFLLCLWLCVRRYGWQWVSPAELTNGMKRFFQINIDIFLRTVCLVAVTVWFTRVGASQGPLMLAVNALLMQMFTMFSFFMDGMGFAAEALCGRYLGAGNRLMLNRSVGTIMVLGVVLALIVTALYFLLGDNLLGLLCSDHAVVAKAHEFMVWAVSIPLVSFSAFLWDGVYIGLTRTRMMLLSMASAMAVYFVLYFSLFSRLGNHGLWIAFLAYLLTRGLVLTLVYIRQDRLGKPQPARRTKPGQSAQ